jgi:hypothetical protein
MTLEDSQAVSIIGLSHNNS